jgi:very-short-patch-repair endonuclease
MSLQGRAWRRLGTGLYCWRGLEEDPWEVLRAWQDLLPANALFAGPTAAWIMGLDFEPTNPIEIVVPPGSGIRSRPGLIARRRIVPSCDVFEVRGLRATNVHRTLRDLCHRLPEVDALVALDMALHKRLTNVTAIGRYNGGSRLRSLAALAAPAESPMETRLRWLLIRRGLPRPEVQVNLGDERNRIGRMDLYYPEARLVLEYDGETHRDRLVEDNRRQNQLLSAGYQLLRFTAGDIYNEPDGVAALVRGALTQAPARRSTSVTIPSRIFSPASQKPGSVMSIPRRRTSSSGRVEPPAARNSR